jgi:homocysteine S-methyltransferase
MEGAVIEHYRKDPDQPLDPHVLNARMIYDPVHRRNLAAKYREYVDIGRDKDVPFIVDAPTWRTNRERVRAAGLSGRDVNRDCVEFIRELVEPFGSYSRKVIVGGLLAPRGDAYRPEEAMKPEDARAYHAWQVDRLAAAGVDFLHAATLPAYSEALGLAWAMAASDAPYVLSFVIRPTGELLDGTPISKVVDTIDEYVSPRPWFYMANCVHSSVLARALDSRPPELTRRLIGFQSNTSSKSPEELDNSTETETEPPDVFAHAMAGLRQKHGLKILGGCCGTDARHIKAMADLVV